MRLGNPIGSAGAAGAAQGAIATSMPFDYAAVFPLRGRRGNIVQDVISISPESDFVAVGMSYGFQASHVAPLAPILPRINLISNTSGTAPGDLLISTFPIDVLMDGIRVNPRTLSTMLAIPPGSSAADLDPGTLTFSTEQQSESFLVQNGFERFIDPGPIQFLLTVIDSATGRELQDQPVSNLASLGEATGRRPFRHFSEPLLLSRRATLRLQVTEETEGAVGDLFIVLFGYKTTIDGCPRPVEVPSSPRTLPFDYVARIPLTGQAGRRVEREVILDTRGGLRVNAVGYALQTDGDVVNVDAGGALSVDLGALTISSIPVSAWIDGIRLRPSMTRLSISSGVTLNATLPGALVNKVFQRMNGPENVQFRYEITDGGTNRQLQNRALFNVAGLGSADGKRPFKRLVKSLEFGPRSTLRVAVEEGAGRGDLFLVFQGYRFDSGEAG